MSALELVWETMLFIFPAYCANAIPVIFGSGKPVDFGIRFFDGRPIFGKNKTMKGFLLGLLGGTVVGLVESYLFAYSIFFGFLLAVGALIGDLMGSFVKRRLGLAPGALLPVFDQLDFVIGALVFSYPLAMLSWKIVLLIFTITFPLHLLTNFLAYKIGFKKNPW